MLADVTCPAGEDEKGRLAGILHILRLSEHSPTDSDYHSTVTLDQRGERRLIPALHKPLQQFVVGQAVSLLGGYELSHVLQNSLQTLAGHSYWFQSSSGSL
jgi:hypothetical protein